MAILVDIADRLYDYSDEETAQRAVAEFQNDTGLTDEAIIALWADERNPQRFELEARIVRAVDLNGSAERAQTQVASQVNLLVGE